MRAWVSSNAKIELWFRTSRASLFWMFWMPWTFHSSMSRAWGLTSASSYGRLSWPSASSDARWGRRALSSLARTTLTGFFSGLYDLVFWCLECGGRWVRGRAPLIRELIPDNGGGGTKGGRWVLGALREFGGCTRWRMLPVWRDVTCRGEVVQVDNVPANPENKGDIAVAPSRLISSFECCGLLMTNSRAYSEEGGRWDCVHPGGVYLGLLMD